MGKKITVHCKEFKYEAEEFNDIVYIHRTYVPAPDSRVVQVLQPREMIFQGSAEEANYLAGAIYTVTGRSEPLKPIEKIQYAAPETDANPVQDAVIEGLATAIMQEAAPETAPAESKSDAN